MIDASLTVTVPWPYSPHSMLSVVVARRVSTPCIENVVCRASPGAAPRRVFLPKASPTNRVRLNHVADEVLADGRVDVCEAERYREHVPTGWDVVDVGYRDLTRIWRRHGVNRGCVGNAPAAPAATRPRACPFLPLVCGRPIGLDTGRGRGMGALLR